MWALPSLPELQLAFALPGGRKHTGLTFALGALNLQGIEFARTGGGHCKERNIQGKQGRI